jgi:hypothetical protein
MAGLDQSLDHVRPHAAQADHSQFHARPPWFVT